MGYKCIALFVIYRYNNDYMSVQKVNLPERVSTVRYEDNKYNLDEDLGKKDKVLSMRG